MPRGRVLGLLANDLGADRFGAGALAFGESVLCVTD
jgi:hypothetical protein